MDYIDNKSEKIGSITVSISNDKSVVINRIRDVTTGACAIATPAR
jgi:hypothetical protein